MTLVSPALVPAAPFAAEPPQVRLFRRVVAALTEAERAVEPGEGELLCRRAVSRAAFQLEPFAIARREEALSPDGQGTLRCCHAAALALRALARLLEIYEVLEEADAAGTLAERQARSVAAARGARGNPACRAALQQTRELLEAARTFQEGWLDDLLQKETV